MQKKGFTENKVEGKEKGRELDASREHTRIEQEHGSPNCGRGRAYVGLFSSSGHSGDFCAFQVPRRAGITQMGPTQSSSLFRFLPLLSRFPVSPYPLRMHRVELSGKCLKRSFKCI